MDIGAGLPAVEILVGDEMAAIRAAEPGGVINGGIGGGEIEPFGGVYALVDLVEFVIGYDILPVDFIGLHWRSLERLGMES